MAISTLRLESEVMDDIDRYISVICLYDGSQHLGKKFEK